MSTKFGKDDSCSCETKKKCVPIGDAYLKLSEDEDWGIIKHLHISTISKIIEYVQEEFSDQISDSAIQEFCFHGEDLHPPLDMDLFLNWFIFNWIPRKLDVAERKYLPSVPLALAFLEKYKNELSEAEEKFIKTVCSSPVSFFRIKDVVSKKRLMVQDLVSKRDYVVKDKDRSIIENKDCIIYGRLVSHDDQAFFCEIGTEILPLDDVSDISELKEFVSFDDFVPSNDQDNLRRLYFGLVSGDEFDEGDDVEVEIKYELKCTPKEVFEILAPAECGNFEDWVNPHTEEDDDLEHVEFCYFREILDNDESDSLASVDIEILGDELFVRTEIENSMHIKEYIENELQERVIFESMQEYSNDDCDNTSHVKYLLKCSPKEAFDAIASPESGTFEECVVVYGDNENPEIVEFIYVNEEDDFVLSQITIVNDELSFTASQEHVDVVRAHIESKLESRVEFLSCLDDIDDEDDDDDESDSESICRLSYELKCSFKEAFDGLSLNCSFDDYIEDSKECGNDNPGYVDFSFIKEIEGVHVSGHLNIIGKDLDIHVLQKNAEVIKSYVEKQLKNKVEFRDIIEFYSDASDEHDFDDWNAEYELEYLLKCSSQEAFKALSTSEFLSYEECLEGCKHLSDDDVEYLIFDYEDNFGNIIAIAEITGNKLLITTSEDSVEDIKDRIEGQLEGKAEFKDMRECEHDFTEETISDSFFDK